MSTLPITPGGPFQIQPGDTLPAPQDPGRGGVDWENFFRGDLRQKEIGPHLRDIFQRAGRSDTPFGMDPSYELDTEALKAFVFDHLTEIGFGLVCVGAMYTARTHPETFPPLIEGVASIIRGIGEVIPG